MVRFALELRWIKTLLHRRKGGLKRVVTTEIKYKIWLVSMPNKVYHLCFPIMSSDSGNKDFHHHRSPLQAANCWRIENERSVFRIKFKNIQNNFESMNDASGHTHLQVELVLFIVKFIYWQHNLSCIPLQRTKNKKEQALKKCLAWFNLFFLGKIRQRTLYF